MNQKNVSYQSESGKNIAEENNLNNLDPALMRLMKAQVESANPLYSQR